MIALIANDNNFVVKNNQEKHFKYITESSSKFCLCISKLFHETVLSHIQTIHKINQSINQSVHFAPNIV